MTRASVGPAVPVPAGGRRLATRRVANWVNTSTALGLLLAVLTRGRICRGPHGLYLVHDSGLRAIFRKAGATTIGDVVFLFMPEERLAGREHLLEHEAMHAGQWAVWLGPIGFLPAYSACSAWSWYRSGSPALRNRFEIDASLLAGGYIRALDEVIPDRRRGLPPRQRHQGRHDR
jgi:hypothetical protein